MKLDTEMYGLVELDVSIGLTKSAVDAYIENGYIIKTNDVLTNNQLDILNSEYTDLIQEYAVNELECYWD